MPPSATLRTSRSRRSAAAKLMIFIAPRRPRLIMDLANYVYILVGKRWTAQGRGTRGDRLPPSGCPG
jgi:hypothetical protein